ncbi:MAG: hypothetical protein HS104_22920 [Polyangiaceae bacterium]|nr:hypothetical protein [Polyangiaceae bacterium]MCL4755751.1 hypothetical protein [Myxococcales bacterium]
MANSDQPEMHKRLKRVETDVGEIKGALVHISHILVDHGDRLDNVTNRLDTLTERVDSFQEAVTQRLDRLIDVTLRARTADTERFADVERRLARLEERVGI